MAAPTFTIIQQVTLAATTATVTFSGIPQTYKDLVLRIAARDTNAAVASAWQLRGNAVATGYAGAYVNYNGTSVTGNAVTAQTGIFAEYGVVGGSAAANVNGALEFYIPNYTAVNNVQLLEYGTTMNFGTSLVSAMNMQAYNGVGAAITSLTFTGGTGLAANSTLTLYGIRNT